MNMVAAMHANVGMRAGLVYGSLNMFRDVVVDTDVSACALPRSFASVLCARTNPRACVCF